MIRLVDPDILGLQEAWNWGVGDEPVIQQFAQELGYNYWGPQESDNFLLSGLILLTKFELIEAENILEDLESGWMKGIIRTPWGKRLHLFHGHRAINNLGDKDRLLELSNVLKDSATIIFGDMNFGSNPPKDLCNPPDRDYPGCTLWHCLLNEGWHLSSSACNGNGIDHIWLSRQLSALNYPIYEECILDARELPSGRTSHDIIAPEEIKALYYDISDHYPSIARIGFKE